MSGAVSKVGKPMMRGMHVAQIKKNIGLAAVFASVTTFGWYWFINKARKDNYRNFYATYDPEKDFQRMKVR